MLPFSKIFAVVQLQRNIEPFRTFQTLICYQICPQRTFIKEQIEPYDRNQLNCYAIRISYTIYQIPDG